MHSQVSGQHHNHPAMNHPVATSYSDNAARIADRVPPLPNYTPAAQQNPANCGKFVNYLGSVHNTFFS